MDVYGFSILLDLCRKSSMGRENLCYALMDYIENKGDLLDNLDYKLLTTIGNTLDAERDFEKEAIRKFKERK